jgi:hypothetical protein
MTNNLFRAALIALALGATAIPAQAASFSFGFGMGDGFTVNRPHRLCLLSDRALRNAIQAQGYRKVFLNVENNNRIQARATRGDWVYLLTVNACTGRILDRDRLRRS